MSSVTRFLFLFDFVSSAAAFHLPGARLLGLIATAVSALSCCIALRKCGGRAPMLRNVTPWSARTG